MAFICPGCNVLGVHEHRCFRDDDAWNGTPACTCALPGCFGDPDKDWSAPECRHGYIILACPESPCPEQDAYLDSARAGQARYEETLQENARVAVREALGLPL